MLFFAAMTLIISSQRLREILENEFANLAVVFEEHLMIISSVTSILSIICFFSWIWPALPRHMAFLGFTVVSTILCTLLWNDMHMLESKKDPTRGKGTLFTLQNFTTIGILVGIMSAMRLWKRSSIHIPCPPGLPIIGHALYFIRSWNKTGNSLVDILNYYRSYYGGIYLIYLGMSPVVVISDAELVKQVISMKHKSFVKSKQGFSSFAPILGGGLVTLEGESWKFHRCIVSPTFNYKYLQDVSFNIFAEVIEKHMKYLADVKSSVNHQTTDIVEVFRTMTLEIIAKATLSFNSDKDVQNLQDLYGSVISEMNLRFWYPYRGWFPTKSNLEYHSKLDKLNQLIISVIQNRRQEFELLEKNQTPYPKRDLLDLMMSGKDDKGRCLSNNDLLSEVKTFLLAGHETTAMWLAYTFHLLVQPENAEAYKKVQEECQAIMQENNNVLQVEDLSKLVYTTNALKESLRIIPTVPVLMRDAVEDVKIGKYSIPEGCKVVIDIWGVHHNSGEWGDDINVYRPDRFNEKQHPFAFLPFSLGPRNCIGQNFAFMEAKIVMLLCFSKFNFRVPVAGHLPMVKYDIPLHPVEGIPLYVDEIDT